jgi:chromosome segregation ATPase
VIWHQGQIRDLTNQITLLEQSLKSREAQLGELSRDLDWIRDHSAELEKTIAARDEALAASTRRASELERANASLAASLNVIHASRGWRLLTRLRKIRDSFRGLAKFRE